MIRIALDTGWTVTPKLGAFEPRTEAASPRAVAIPHDALRDLPRSPEADGGSHTGYIPGAVVEYATTIDVPESWRERTVLIEFEGVYRDAVVAINGDVVVHEPNGYSAFVVVADGHLRFGEPNRISVEARSHKDSRWYTGAGIYRPVHLVVAESVHIALDGVVVTTPDIEPDRAVVEIATTVENRTRHLSTLRLTWSIIGPDGAVVLTGTSPVTTLPNDRATARARLVVPHPQLWDVDTPHLYRVRAVLEGDGRRLVDEAGAVFGIRRLQLDPIDGLRINGRITKLRGACVHHDNGPLGAITHPAAEDRRVRILKEAGFTAIRSAHNPASKALLDACDRHGMLVMDELTDVWTRSKTAFDSSIGFGDRWQRDVAAMVAKDINHPSVIMYSIGNEILELATPHGSAWSRRIAERVRALDPTRYVTNGINGIIANLDRIAEAQAELASDPNTMMAGMGEQLDLMNAADFVTQSTEESAAVLDVVGLNYAQTRYALDARLFPNRVIVGSETFADRIASLWGLVREHPHVIGDFTWTGWDYIGEAGIGRVDFRDAEGYVPTGTVGPYPYLLAECGDIDITGHRKPASYYREIAFGLRVEPVIAVHRPQSYGRPVVKTPWSWDDVVSSWSWAAEPGAPVSVDVYADADEVELLLDGVPLARAGVGASGIPLLARFDTVYRPGVLTAVSWRDGIELARSSVRTAAPDFGLTIEAESERIAADGLAYVRISLADAADVVPCDADRLVRVEVSGAGELAGLGSGRARTTESFGAEEVTTFDGRALAVVRPTGRGEARVVVSDGDREVSATLLVGEADEDV